LITLTPPRIFSVANNAGPVASKIDYKTSMFTQGDLDDFLANEQKKYLEKMQQYHSAIKMNEDRPIKLGLYFPALPAWKEWEV